MTYLNIRETNENAKLTYQIESRAREEGFEFVLFGGFPATILRLDSKNASKTAEMAIKCLKATYGLLSMLYELKVSAGDETFSIIITGYLMTCADIVNILKTHVHFDAIGRNLMGAVYKNCGLKKDETILQTLLRSIELAVPPATAALLTPPSQGDTNFPKEVKT
jgi:hypothetical protein